MEMYYYNWLFVFLRISAFLLVLPFFTMANFPVMMRVALGGLAAILLAPLLPPFAANHLDFFALLGVMFQEVSVGLLLGFVARLIFFTVELSGNLIATEMGLNMAAVLDPVSGQSEQMPSTMLSLLAALVMLTLNLHHWMLLGFVRTYAVLPVGAAHLSAALFELLVARTGDIFLVALQIAAPVMAVSFVVTVVFALLGRAVPQMNVFSESFGFRIVAGLVVFGFTLQIAAQYVQNYLDRLPNDLLAVAHLLGGAR
jgi:flagellar biosynthetic protein FliR